MPRSLTFEVIGEPQAKLRARHYIAAGHVKTYTPKETVQYENLVRQCCREAQMQQVSNWEGFDPNADSVQFAEFLRFRGALSVEVEAWFNPSESRSKGKHAIREGQPHCQRPDADNVLKAILDGMASVAFNNDMSVYEKHIVKRWTYGAARCVVTVREEL